MSFKELVRPIPVFVVGKGNASAIGVVDEGEGESLMWVSVLDETGEVHAFPNHMVRRRDEEPVRQRQPTLETIPSGARVIALAGADEELCAFP